MPDAKYKSCSICRQSKSAELFYKHRGTKDGLRPDCKECRSEVQKRYKKSERGKEVNREAGRRYSGSEIGKKAKIAKQKRYIAKFPEKVRARSHLNTAIKAGHIIRRPCEVCGTEPAHGHHDNYSKPLEVRWLCQLHHTEEHKKHLA